MKAEETPDTEEERSQPSRPVSGTSMRESKTTACIPCTKNHLSAVAGILSEAARFARSGGIKDPEVIGRLDIVTKELTAAERGDLDPAKIASLPLKEKEIAEWATEQIRDLRHYIDGIKDPETLEKAIVKADEINKDMIGKFIGLIAS